MHKHNLPSPNVHCSTHSALGSQSAFATMQITPSATPTDTHRRLPPDAKQTRHGEPTTWVMPTLRTFLSLAFPENTIPFQTILKPLLHLETPGHPLNIHRVVFSPRKPSLTATD